MNGTDVPAIVLAAGASRRMGTPKALLLWKGKPLVHHLCETLVAGGAASPVCVVIGPDETGSQIKDAVAELSFVQCVVNPSPERGMLSSVQTGLLSVDPANGFLVCPCDLPKLQPETIRVVIKEADTFPDRIIVPIYEGKRGHPTCFSSRFREEIRAINPQAFGLNELLRRYPALVHEIPVGSDSIWRDTDTPDEWRQLTQEE